MKKIAISIILITIFFINSNSQVYATDENTWVKDAFKATSDFLNEDTTDYHGVLSPTFTFFKNVIKAINRILIVALAGITTIALSVTGVRYMASGGNPHERDKAKKSLHTIFVGMAFGFGAYIIWQIAMAIVTIIIGSFATS